MPSSDAPEAAALKHVSNVRLPQLLWPKTTISFLEYAGLCSKVEDSSAIRELSHQIDKFTKVVLT